MGIPRKALLVGAWVTSLAVVGGVGVAWSSVLDDPAPETLSACVRAGNEAMRLETPENPCKPDRERRVTWNVQGAPGPKGDTGAEGPAGPPGEPGEAYEPTYRKASNTGTIFAGSQGRGIGVDCLPGEEVLTGGYLIEGTGPTGFVSPAVREQLTVWTDTSRDHFSNVLARGWLVLLDNRSAEDVRLTVRITCVS
jgi:hypothetical protein